MQVLAQGDYTQAMVVAALHGNSRQIGFRYELLDSSNVKKADLTNILSGHVGNNALAQIKRTARFTVQDDGAIDFLSDRIKPYVRIWIPPGKITHHAWTSLGPWQPYLQPMRDDPQTGGWAEWPQGVFLLSSPTKKIGRSGVVIREVEAYDQLQILVDDKVDDRYTIAAATNYITAVNTLLTGAGINMVNLTATTKTLPVAKDWPIGTSKLHIINDLLAAINYKSLWFDENGYAIAEPYISPANRGSEYSYEDDSTSVIVPEMRESLDLFDVPNKWILMVSESDRTMIKSDYTNSNASSPTSTTSRGRTIVEVRSVDAVDQTTLDEMAERAAFEASQVYEEVEWESWIMPHHSDYDVYTLTRSGLNIDDKYSEHAWGFDLVRGAKMRHKCRRVVNI